jgi:serine/threonine-protein kinase
MGEVWHARDLRLGRDVALKVLPEAYASDPERIVRFQREARALAAFNHPNIAAIHSFENVEGVQLLVMEMVPGGTVRELLANGPLPLERSLEVARQTAAALQAAHAKGILHRDLKPANVKVTPDGTVKLLDFGLAKALGISSGVDLSNSPTVDGDPSTKGAVLGTAPYMSPEQARGMELDERSDVWAFGCVLYEMLTGAAAFGGLSPPGIFVAILEREPDWSKLPEGTPGRVVRLLHGCLTKSRDRRMPDMAHVRQELQEAPDGPTTAVPRSPLSGSRRYGRLPRVWLAAGAILAAALGLLTWATFRGQEMKALPSSKLLAVLPATDLTGRPDGRQLCAGVSFGLGVKLQSLPGVTVMRPSSPSMFAETDPAKWARDTGANVLVQPAVRQMGDTRQLSFSVFLAGSPVQLAADEVTGPAAEHFRLEDELTRKLVSALSVHLTSGGLASPRPAPSLPSGSGQTDYVVALGYLERYDDQESVKKAVALLSGIPDGESSALVQAALGRALLASYDLSKDASSAELARRASEKALALDPSLPEAQLALGRILLATGETEKGIQILKKVLERQPKDADALRVLAMALTKAGRLEEAEKTYRTVVQLKPRAWSAYSGLGYFYFRAGRYQEAVDAYRKGAELNPDVARLYYNLGASYLRMRRYSEAEAAFRRSIDIAPQPTAFSNLGTLFYLQGRYQDAAQVFRKATDLSPLDLWNHKALADALIRLPGRRPEGIAEYQETERLALKALQVNPKDGEAHAALGAGRAETAGPEKGLASIRRAIDLDPASPVVHQCAASVFQAAGKSGEALDSIEKALAHGLSVDEIEAAPDLASLRGDPRYLKIVETYRNRKETP